MMRTGMHWKQDLARALDTAYHDQGGQENPSRRRYFHETGEDKRGKREEDETPTLHASMIKGQGRE